MKKTTNQRLSTLDLVYIAVGAALIAICSWISVPLTVPFTLQTFAVFFLLTLFGGKRGTLSVLVYILLGAVGLPVFSGMQGGIGVLAGNTGGYILGFLLTGLIFWGAEALFGKSAVSQLAALTLGLAVCYLFGTVWFLVLYTRTKGAVSIATVLSWCVLPFIVPDLLKMALAFMTARRIAPLLQLGQNRQKV